MDTEYAKKVANLNDVFRKAGFGVMTTPGVRGLYDLSGLISAVCRYNNFDEDNDPYGEHDFGTIYWQGKKVFFKIDYYDESLTYYGDPLSRECRRILTVMLAEEY